MRKVEVLPYDEQWVELFADEADKIRKILADVRDTYGELKRKLSKQFPYDIDSYIAGKEALAAQIQRDALEWKQKSAT